jgi:hypothetical protein
MSQETGVRIQKFRSCNAKALALFRVQAARNPRLMERSFSTAFGIIWSA